MSYGEIFNTDEPEPWPSAEPTRWKCDRCHGDGWLAESEHSAKCTDSHCSPECPIEVQGQCPTCNGLGYIEG